MKSLEALKNINYKGSQSLRALWTFADVYRDILLGVI